MVSDRNTCGCNFNDQEGKRGKRQCRVRGENSKGHVIFCVYKDIINVQYHSNLFVCQETAKPHFHPSCLLLNYQGRLKTATKVKTKATECLGQIIWANVQKQDNGKDYS